MLENDNFKILPPIYSAIPPICSANPPIYSASPPFRLNNSADLLGKSAVSTQ
jgi:hypothetical protein